MAPADFLFVCCKHRRIPSEKRSRASMEDVFLLCARSRRDSVAYCSGSGTSILRMKERCKKSLLVSAIVLGLLVFHKCSADGEPSSSDRDPMPFTRRKLLVLDQILGGGDRNYVSANDVLFAVLRANKRDIEMVGRGNPQVANVLRSGMEQLTNWVRNPIQPGGVSSVRAVVVLAFGDARHCANDALAWITANQFVGTPAGSLQASTEVWAQGPVAQALPKHHIITSLSSVPFTANEDLRRAVPKIIQALTDQNSTAVRGSTVMVISHPDQSVRAAKIFESFGYEVAVPDFQGTPWTVFGCDDVGYTNATAVRHTSSREQYIRYELNMRARQVDDGSLFF